MPISNVSPALYHHSGHRHPSRNPTPFAGLQWNFLKDPHESLKSWSVSSSNKRSVSQTSMHSHLSHHSSSSIAGHKASVFRSAASSIMECKPTTADTGLSSAIGDELLQSVDVERYLEDKYQEMYQLPATPTMAALDSAMMEEANKIHRRHRRKHDKDGERGDIDRHEGGEEEEEYQQDGMSSSDEDDEEEDEEDDSEEDEEEESDGGEWNVYSGGEEAHLERHDLQGLTRTVPLDSLRPANVHVPRISVSNGDGASAGLSARYTRSSVALSLLSPGRKGTARISQLYEEKLGGPSPDLQSSGPSTPVRPHYDSNSTSQRRASIKSSRRASAVDIAAFVHNNKPRPSSPSYFLRPPLRVRVATDVPEELIRLDLNFDLAKLKQASMELMRLKSGGSFTAGSMVSTPSLPDPSELKGRPHTNRRDRDRDREKDGSQLTGLSQGTRVSAESYYRDTTKVQQRLTKLMRQAAKQKLEKRIQKKRIPNRFRYGAWYLPTQDWYQRYARPKTYDRWRTLNMKAKEDESSISLGLKQRKEEEAREIEEEGRRLDELKQLKKTYAQQIPSLPSAKLWKEHVVKSGDRLPTVIKNVDTTDLSDMLEKAATSDAADAMLSPSLGRASTAGGSHADYDDMLRNRYMTVESTLATREVAVEPSSPSKNRTLSRSLFSTFETKSPKSGNRK
eukprot:GILJ01004342.1.p1 GENE.GILJ01004342.1~~GILJ01004342.1.p1  ORF type:complete len:679 (-),score=127.27 GILJ01004342.1:88-2124(-)